MYTTHHLKDIINMYFMAMKKKRVSSGFFFLFCFAKDAFEQQQNCYVSRYLVCHFFSSLEPMLIIFVSIIAIKRYNRRMRERERERGGKFN